MSKPTPFMEFIDEEQGKWERERKKEGTYKRGDKYFAAWLGIPPTTFSELKNGSREASPYQLRRIARRLPGVLKVVSHGQGDFQNDPRLQVLAKIYKDLPETDKQKLVDVANDLISDDSDDGQGSTDLRQINLGLT